MWRLADIPYRAWLLVAFLVILPLSWIGAASTIDLVLQHTPTVVIVTLLVLTGVRRPLSNVTYTLFFIFMLLHVVGARYLYSNVPYDDWCDALFGFRLGEALAFRRNHYDRFVHLCFGLLMIWPAREIVERMIGVRGGWSWVVGVWLLLAFSSTYELLEWVVAMVMAPDTAEKYNGQQGDAWDAHRDMALALIGAVVSGVVLSLARRRGRALARATPMRRRRQPLRVTPSVKDELDAGRSAGAARHAIEERSRVLTGARDPRLQPDGPQAVGAVAAARG
ncbi:MAG: DUF2238 domain-containing protein [Planctomycetota bacterium]|jgi:putative membrane protein